MHRTFLYLRFRDFIIIPSIVSTASFVYTVNTKKLPEVYLNPTDRRNLYHDIL